MDDEELDKISRDVRFSGRLKKKTKAEKEAFRNLFEGIDEDKTYKDRHGRPWKQKPLDYAKQLIKKQQEEGDSDEDADDEEDSDEEISSDEDSDSASNEGSVGDNLADLQDADWNLLVEDAPVVEEATRRLAVLHFDWDNTNAEVIFLALESFLPPGACLEKVTIYPSEYGMRKMAEEEAHGPRDIFTSDNEDAPDAEGTNTTAAPKEGPSTVAIETADADEKKAWRVTSSRVRSRLRRYQLNRLKYFFAIAEFDSAATATAVYEACDGVEYASSGIRFDLRFVPDGETFEVLPSWVHLVSECSEVNRAKYKPRAFENTALHSTRVKLTWDRTPATRTQWLREQFEEGAEPKRLFKEGKAELSEYVALSSSGQSTAAPSDVDEPGPAPTVPRIHRHRPKKVPPEQLRAALLAAIKSDGDENGEKLDSDKNDDGAEDLVGNSDDDEEEETVFDLNAADDDDAAAAAASASSGEDEEYDLTAEDEKLPKKRGAVLDPRTGRKALSRRRLPEVEAAEDSDSSLSFEDMEGRLSDDDDSDKIGHRRGKKRRRIEGDDGEEEADGATSKARKKKHRQAMRQKAQMRRKKQEKNQEKVKDLWADAEADSRFDDFLRDPAFGVSQLHREYKEATEFLNFMRKRRAPALKAAKAKGSDEQPPENNG